jgi:Flp pilus assembly protein TadD
VSVRNALVLLASLAASACGTSGATRSAAIELRGEHGFTINERRSVGSDVRGEFERAIGLLEQGEHQAGIALLVMLTEAAPQMTTLHLDLGIAYARVGDFGRAEASLKRALDLNSRHPVAHNELGILYRKTGRFKEARRSYERALALHSDFHYARLNLAILCDLYLSDPECALKQYELYAQAVPSDKAVSMWIADLRARSKK